METNWISHWVFVLSVVPAVIWFPCFAFQMSTGNWAGCFHGAVCLLFSVCQVKQRTSQTCQINMLSCLTANTWHIEGQSDQKLFHLLLYLTRSARPCNIKAERSRQSNLAGCQNVIQTNTIHTLSPKHDLEWPWAGSFWIAGVIGETIYLNINNSDKPSKILISRLFSEWLKCWKCCWGDDLSPPAGCFFHHLNNPKELRREPDYVNIR